MTSPELSKPDRLRQETLVIPEDLHPEDPRYLQVCLAFMKKKRLSPVGRVFTGLNGQPVLEGKPLPKVDVIYAMNLAGWESTYGKNISAIKNPGHYGDLHSHGGAPAIAIIRQDRLAEAFEHGLDHESGLELADDLPGGMSLGGTAIGFWNDDPSKPEGRFTGSDEYEIVDRPIEFKEVELGSPLVELPAGTEITEGVAHINYPNAWPIDEIEALVFIKRVAPKQPKTDRRRGPHYRT